MFFGSNHKETRQYFFNVWKKYQEKTPLGALEGEILQVILDHPEYHSLLNQANLYIDQSWLPEQGMSNPFLHMGLHLAIREQLSTDRPKGIVKIYQSLLKKHGDKLQVEHLMLEVLAEALWLAQKNQSLPDEKSYLLQMKKLK